MSPEAPPLEDEAARAQVMVQRFGRWLAWGIGVAVLLYLAGSVWAGVRDVGEALARFAWLLYIPVLLLTLVNYGLRFWKWHYLLGRLGVHVPVRENLIIFASGLAMVVSPAKAGEVLKPYLVRVRTGAPMAQTLPALVTERLTDGIATLILAAISVGTYASDRAWVVFGLIGMVAVGIAVLSHEGLSLTLLRGAERIPGVHRLASKLEILYRAMRVCVAPVPLLLTVGASMIAWGAECVGYLLVFRGFGLDVSLDLCTFLYAFATVLGGFMPGGLGVADGALVGGSLQFVEGLSHADAVASALLIRAATLWFGELLGALAMLRVPALLGNRRGRSA